MRLDEAGDWERINDDPVVSMLIRNVEHGCMNRSVSVRVAHRAALFLSST